MDIWTLVIGLAVGFLIGFVVIGIAVSAKIEKVRSETYKEVYEECTTSSLEHEQEVIDLVKNDIWRSANLEKERDDIKADLELLQKSYDKLYEEHLALIRKQLTYRGDGCCDCYDFREHCCNGTRERDSCTCGGEKAKCDFYPEMRAQWTLLGRKGNEEDE